MKRIYAVLAITAAAVFVNGASIAQTPEQKAVLVTGANSGIGLRITETLAASGFHVYAGARKDEDLARLNSMDNVSAVRLDVTVQEDIDAAAKFVRAQGRGLWGIVNNAGIVRYAPLVDGPEADFRLTFEVNVFGPFRVNQAFLPLVIESGGRTAIIGSINGFIPAASSAGYAASKFAVEGYTDSLAEELEGTGVHAAIVEPGSYKSGIRDRMYEAAVEAAESGNLELDAQAREGLARSTVRNETLQEPDDVARAVLHLMSSEFPKRRYMVTPNAEQAALTIRMALGRTLQLNEDQPYSYDRDELVAFIDELLEGAE
ncbi:MAG: SDR family NAD(P)-dependent oxidoreductase [Gammaproteobacteria bacterium]|nr:SDR family NAD(P)-dependent oxidoreductase [Gammaproteobacteria bacterium]